MTSNLKTQKIIEWRQCLNILPDNQFFDLVHIYLGKVSTPYNKTNLIERLSAFLRKDENKKNIIALLSEEDKKFLSAIKFIPECTYEKLEKFFEGDENFSSRVLVEKIENLSQRLLIFFSVDKISGKKILEINPLLEDEIEKFLTPQNLFNLQKKEFTANSNPLVKDDFLAAFISYVLSHEDLCRQNGEFKKKTLLEITQFFESSAEKLQLIFNSLRNLNIFVENGENFTVDWPTLEKFSELEKKFRIIYLCAAAYGHFSRSSIQKNASLFYSTICTMGNSAYEKNSILQLSYILKEKNGGAENFSGGRFSQILMNASETSTGENFFGGNAVINAMIDAAFDFGIFCVQNENFYSVSENFTNLSSKQNPDEIQKKVLNLDSVFSVSIMPGLSLFEYLDLLKFLSIVRSDTVSIFEITKKSSFRAFDCGMNVEKILLALEKYSSYEIPQSVKILLEEWFSSYSAGNLYKGFVLKVSPENSLKVQKSPVLKNYITEILADGIFLLNFQSDEEAKTIIEKSGLDFVGKIKDASKKSVSLGFRELYSRTEDFLPLKTSAEKQENFCDEENSTKKILDDLNKELEKIKMSSEQKQALEFRIKNRLIVNKEQLRPESVRFEVREAFGMDFQAKVLLIESAIQSDSLVELELESNKKAIVGDPLNFNRKTGLLTIKTIPDNVEKEISLAYVLRIKKLGTFF